jgi:hypothetical protein
MRSLSRAALLGSLLLGTNAQSTTRSWDEAIELAQSTVSQLTRDEKIGIVTGIGFTDESTLCCSLIDDPISLARLLSINLTLLPSRKPSLTYLMFLLQLSFVEVKPILLKGMISQSLGSVCKMALLVFGATENNPIILL